MKTLVRKPYHPFMGAPNLFDEIFGYGGTENSRTTLPAVNILEGETGFSVEMALPGIKKEQVKVEWNEDVLSISSEVAGAAEKEGRFTRKEFSISNFTRKFRFPEKTIDGENVHAKMEDGVLEITLPRLQKQNLSKAVKIA